MIGETLTTMKKLKIKDKTKKHKDEPKQNDHVPQTSLGYLDELNTYRSVPLVPSHAMLDCVSLHFDENWLIYHFCSFQVPNHKGKGKMNTLCEYVIILYNKLSIFQTLKILKKNL
jgi:hypothetical protein